MNWLIAPWHYSLMQSAFLAVTLVGTTCGVLGSYVVLRRLAFIGDAMSHAALPGVVVAYLNGLSIFFGALIACLLTALGIGWLSRRQDIHEETAIGVVFTGMLALGFVIIAKTKSFRDFSGMLFGGPLSVTHSDLILMAVSTVIVLIVLALFYKELELTSADPSYSAVVGLRADWMRYVLLLLLALTVVSGIEVGGALLTPALLVTPAAAASLLTRKLFAMMVLSSLFAVSSGFVGLYVSFYADFPPGATIVLTGIAWFVLAFLFQRLAPGLKRRPQASNIQAA